MCTHPQEPPDRPPRSNTDSDPQEVSEWGLERGDVLLIRQRLKLTPAERLRAAQELINTALRIRARNAR